MILLPNRKRIEKESKNFHLVLLIMASYVYQNCPSCFSYVAVQQKKINCSIMECEKCATSFCLKCGTKLSNNKYHGRCKNQACKDMDFISSLQTVKAKLEAHNSQNDKTDKDIDLVKLLSDGSFVSIQEEDDKEAEEDDDDGHVVKEPPNKKRKRNKDNNNNNTPKPNKPRNLGNKQETTLNLNNLNEDNNDDLGDTLNNPILLE